MKNSFTIELFKITKRREFIIIMSMLLLPFLLPVVFLVAPDSYSIQYSFGNMVPFSAYTTIGYAFWGALGVFVILFSILTANMLSSEIDSHYYFLYFPRINNRRQIYNSKLKALLLVTVVWYLVYTLLMNTLGYGFFSKLCPDIVSSTFQDGSLTYWIVMWFIYLIEIVFYVNLSLALGTKYKPLTTISIILIVFYGSMFLHEIPLFKYLIQEHYKQATINSENLSNFNPLIRNFILYLVITAVYDVIFYVLATKRIRKIEN